MNDYASIGRKLRAARLSRRITQEQLGEAAGVGVIPVSHLENGTGAVSLKVFIVILNHLGCSADEVLCRG